MTGQEFQDRVDALVVDLQTVGKGQTVNIMLRGLNNSSVVLPLSSNAQGVVNGTQMQLIQDYLDDFKLTADSYTTTFAPVQTAMDAFKTASAPHDALTETARVARVALSDALLADPTYQSAKTALDNARANPDYVSASFEYKRQNISENFAELSNAKGKYVVV